MIGKDKSEPAILICNLDPAWHRFGELACRHMLDLLKMPRKTHLWSSTSTHGPNRRYAEIEEMLGGWPRYFEDSRLHLEVKDWCRRHVQENPIVVFGASNRTCTGLLSTVLKSLEPPDYDDTPVISILCYWNSDKAHGNVAGADLDETLASVIDAAPPSYAFILDNLLSDDHEPGASILQGIRLSAEIASERELFSRLTEKGHRAGQLRFRRDCADISMLTWPILIDCLSRARQRILQADCSTEPLDLLEEKLSSTTDKPQGSALPNIALSEPFLSLKRPLFHVAELPSTVDLAYDKAEEMADKVFDEKIRSARGYYQEKLRSDDSVHSELGKLIAKVEPFSLGLNDLAWQRLTRFRQDILDFISRARRDQHSRLRAISSAARRPEFQEQASEGRYDFRRPIFDEDKALKLQAQELRTAAAQLGSSRALLSICFFGMALFSIFSVMAALSPNVEKSPPGDIGELFRLIFGIGWPAVVGVTLIIVGLLLVYRRSRKFKWLLDHARARADDLEERIRRIFENVEPFMDGMLYLRHLIDSRAKVNECESLFAEHKEQFRVLDRWLYQLGVEAAGNSVSSEVAESEYLRDVHFKLERHPPSQWLLAVLDDIRFEEPGTFRMSTYAHDDAVDFSSQFLSRPGHVRLDAVDLSKAKQSGSAKALVRPKGGQSK